VELFEQIRREYEFGVGTIAGVSRKLGVHRRMVREALHSAEPAATKPHQRRLRKLDSASDFIDRTLRADVSAPPKQRHTARRIFDRLRVELPGLSGSERTVRGFVRRRRQQLGLEHREVFVPQMYAWGSEAQVDSRWIGCSSHFFLPVIALSRVFRGKFTEGLRALYKRDQLQFRGALLKIASPSFLQQLPPDVIHEGLPRRHGTLRPPMPPTPAAERRPP
jgi:hypothetical protein